MQIKEKYSDQKLTKKKDFFHYIICIIQRRLSKSIHMTQQEGGGGKNSNNIMSEKKREKDQTSLYIIFCIIKKFKTYQKTSAKSEGHVQTLQEHPNFSA